ncbi:fibronectin type III domain-containing protein [Eubacterium oxidoreducens]|uniref:Fibronectin type III domain-containing protein n=1 Tax=Eubacterium oxidoreducens TaxID=1732 RepID=A0A1G6BGP0_EUBOX|nr:fibronectin type III domain-containing protein [Eubacterium oxidoreducens]SDB19797.1 Fibronectin type III domain-containing protein [Eubacterium oxidoreducens]
MMRRKSLSITLACAMILGTLTPISVVAQEDSSRDTSWYNENESAFEIDSAAELAGLDYLVDRGTSFKNCTIALTDNIDLSSVEFEAIGTESNTFKGTFDGNGNTIYGLQIVATDGYEALFANNAGTIKNLTVSGTVTSTGTDSYVAGIAAYNSGTISNVTSQVTVTANTTSFVGGITGINTGTITDTKNVGDVSGTKPVGGIAGENAATIIKSSNIGNITEASGVSSKAGVGGIAGWNGDKEANATAEISDCYSLGTINGGSSSWVGGIAGFNNSKSTINKVYFAGALSYGSTKWCAAIVGQNENLTMNGESLFSLDSIASTSTASDTAQEIAGTAKTSDELKESAATLGENWETDTLAVNDGYPVMKGTIDTSWYTENATSGLIDSAQDLLGLAYLVDNGNDLSGVTVTLSNNLNLAGYNFNPIGGEVSVNEITSVYGFAGTFDGNGKTIKGLSIASEDGYAALFAKLSYTGSIADMTVSGAVASTTAENYVAGIVAYNEGAINSVYNKVSVTAESAFNVGGIAGYNADPTLEGDATETATNKASITNCCSVADITGNKVVGGIAGENHGVINRCYTTGVIDGTNSSSKNGVGGIAGRNGNNNTATYAALINNCYSVASVGRSGQRWVGGITGFNNNLSSITNSYFAGTLTGGSSYAAIAYNDSDTARANCSNNYALSTIESGSAEEADTGIGKTSDELKALASTLGEDWTGDSNAINAGYPVLTWQTVVIAADADDTVAPTVTETEYTPTYTKTFTEGGTYSIEGSKTLITISTTEAVTIEGDADTTYKDINIVSTIAGADITIKNLKTEISKSGTYIMEFTGSDNTLTVQGTNVLDNDQGSSYAGIHVAKDAGLTLMGDGCLYMYKNNGGAAIGGNGELTLESETIAAEGNGAITFEGGNYFLYGTRACNLVGVGSGSTAQSDVITIDGANIYCINAAMGVAFGGNENSAVEMKSGLVNVNVDWGGLAVDGTMTYAGGSVRTYLDKNTVTSYQGWNGAYSAPGVYGNVGLGTTPVNATGDELALYVLDTSQISSSLEDICVKEGTETLYDGGLYAYTYYNADGTATSTASSTMEQWGELNDTNLYLYLTKEAHTLTVDGTKISIIYDDTNGFTRVSDEETDASVTTISMNQCKVSSISNKVYTGKAITPNVKVTYGTKTLTKGTDYTVSYASNKKIGTATVTITGIHNYKGTITKKFKIVPGKAVIKSAKVSKKKVTLKFAALGNDVSYQIKYKKKGSSSWKTVTVSKKSKKITKLTSGKKYVFKVRAYKKIGKTTYYGAWSKNVTKKVK